MSVLALTDVLGLISSDPFELSTLTALENFVSYELSSKEYDFEVNKALLRSYQVNAEQIKLDHVVNVLLLALMRLPSTDFLALSYLVHGKLALQPKLKQVQNFYDLLERAEFAKFWDELKEADATLTTAAAGFNDFMRSFILSSTRDTFRNISKELLQKFLGLAASEVDAYLSSNPLIEQVLIVVQNRNAFIDSRGRSDRALTHFCSLVRLTVT
jgi:translation initiation factor 3 subunit K